jgi:uncharacterized membrane protein YkoI
MTDKFKKILLGIAALAALAMGGSALAGAAGGGSTSTPAAQEQSEPADTDNVQDENGRDDATEGDTGKDEAGAESEGDGKALTGDTLTRASEAALAATGGGKVGQTEADGEKGATYEVEVTKADGSQVDVRLDDQFKVVAIDADHEQTGEHQD